jgi:hypothetical protein
MLATEDWCFELDVAATSTLTDIFVVPPHVETTVLFCFFLLQILCFASFHKVTAAALYFKVC